MRERSIGYVGDHKRKWQRRGWRVLALVFLSILIEIWTSAIWGIPSERFFKAWVGTDFLFFIIAGACALRADSTPS